MDKGIIGASTLLVVFADGPKGGVRRRQWLRRFLKFAGQSFLLAFGLAFESMCVVGQSPTLGSVLIALAGVSLDVSLVSLWAALIAAI